MYRVSFAICTLIAVFVCSLPVIAFIYLKYNGLTDRPYDDETDDIVTEEYCRISVQFGSFVFSSSTGNSLCVALICADGNCAIKATNSETTVAESQSDSLRAAVSKEFDALIAPSGEQADEDKDESETPPGSEEIKVESYYKYPLWQWLSIFSIAVTFSIVGVATSITSRKREFIGLSVESTPLTILTVYFYSSFSGVVVVCLFASGIIQGEVFPNFSGDILNFGFNSWSALKFRGQDWFKLAIWAYISGFYERFIPDMFDNLLEKTNQKVLDDKKPA